MNWTLFLLECVSITVIACLLFNWYRAARRDFFAAHAMQGLLTAEIVGQYTNEHVAEISYVIADAMLKARSE